jgi:hypothetical protein
VGESENRAQWLVAVFVIVHWRLVLLAFAKTAINWVMDLLHLFAQKRPICLRAPNRLPCVCSWFFGGSVVVVAYNHGPAADRCGTKMPKKKKGRTHDCGDPFSALCGEPVGQYNPPASPPLTLSACSRSPEPGRRRFPGTKNYCSSSSPLLCVCLFLGNAR